MKTYKVRYEGLDRHEHINFYDTKKEAERFYELRKKEKVIETKWAELIEIDWDGDHDGDEVINSFDREVRMIFNRPIFTGRFLNVKED